MTKEEISEAFQSLQNHICDELEKLEEDTGFVSDKWDRTEGGGGDSRTINGDVIEKGGVNFSKVFGPTPEKIINALNIEPADFFATGVSIVLHPRNPHVPIIHMNVRYFEMSNGTWWFGGGIDLTPHYVVESDATYFHKKLQEVCDKHDVAKYDFFKKWADDYFYLKHRKETRGIGGIFFDRLSDDKKSTFDFVQDVGFVFPEIYLHLATKNKDLPYSENELNWQRLRRGRYVEFNLLWDKGTKFGLDTDGRTESILMSLPPEANWEYNYNAKEGSPEAQTLSKLKKDIDWVNA